MPFRIQVVLGFEILFVLGTLFCPDWGLILLVFFTFVRPQDDRPNVAPLHIQGAITWAVLAATFFRPGVFSERLGFALKELRWFIALFFLMCISAFVNGRTIYSMDQLNDSLTIVVVCILILLWINDEKHLRALVWTFIAAGLYYYQMVLRDPSYMKEEQYTRIWFRNATNFGNPNFLALFMVIVIFLTLGLLGAVTKVWTRVLLLSASCAFFAVFLKCESRGGTLAMGVSIIVFWLMQRQKLLCLLALGIALTLGITFLAPPSYLSRLKTIVNYQQDESAQTRLEMWSHSIEMIKSNPLLGIGPGNFGPRFPHGMTQHEAYLQTASEVGLPALVLYVVLLVGACGRAWVARRLAAPGNKNRPLLLGVSEAAICAIVAIAVAGFFTGLAFREFVYITICLTSCLRELAAKAPSVEGALGDSNEMAVARDVWGEPVTDNVGATPYASDDAYGQYNTGDYVSG